MQHVCALYRQHTTHACRHSNAFVCMTVFTRYICARVSGCVYTSIYMCMCILRMPFASVLCTHICLAWQIRAYEYWCCVGSLSSISLSFTHTLSLSLSLMKVCLAQDACCRLSFTQHTAHTTLHPSCSLHTLFAVLAPAG